MPNLIATLGAITAIATTPFAVGLQTAAAPAPATEAETSVVAPQMSEAERTALLDKMSEALSGVKTATGKFEQLSPDFQVTTGRFAIARPGKLRFDYDEPSPFLLVSDGTTVGLQDSELRTTDRIFLAQTPYAILLDDQLDLESRAEILDVSENRGQAAVTLRDKSGEMDGTLTLIFADETMELIGWRVVDSGGNITSIQLSDVEYGKRLNPRLFILKDFEEE